MKQELLWIPVSRKVPFDRELPRGTLLWTLLDHKDEKVPPTLPLKLIHFENAFLEDRLHDWNLRKGQLSYYSRISEGGVWVVLEIPEE